MAEDATTHYDFSEYSLDHPLYSARNRKALGFFKEELNSVSMQQFVGLRPKRYAFLCTDKVSNNLFQHTNFVEKNTAKDVKRLAKDAHLHFAHYLDAHNNFHTYFCRQNLIKSTLHIVRTVHMCKVGLAAYKAVAVWRYHSHSCTWSPEYIAVVPFVVSPSLCIPSLLVPLSIH